jgi:predicted SAM-dependent methyltransferase
MYYLKKNINFFYLKKLAIYLFQRINFFIGMFKWKKIKSLDCVNLELGSGAKKGFNGWITVDLNNADICHDLRKGIPLSDLSVDRIYTSHMLEHIPYKELILFINECFRVLKHGGELSVCVPNASNYINAYYEKRFFRKKGEGYAPFIVETGSFMDQVNYIAYMGGQHQYLFDKENLINTIGQSPFTSVKLREFDPKLDLHERDFESIYAIAIK